ncbi:hypothetical protein QAD02_013771 [Eretmocerus hayati]|uniref:Uncharacterized protein n=1 Tax=Eretmocerus hayati TaxID=131215 RepID=A0ACC2P3T6_9HYME|nr:hypothetical protein QAD02_013771 [Eretmocerus hayati]
MSPLPLCPHQVTPPLLLVSMGADGDTVSRPGRGTGTQTDTATRRSAEVQGYQAETPCTVPASATHGVISSNQNVGQQLPAPAPPLAVAALEEAYRRREATVHPEDNTRIAPLDRRHRAIQDRRYEHASNSMNFHYAAPAAETMPTTDALSHSRRRPAAAPLEAVAALEAAQRRRGASNPTPAIGPSEPTVAPAARQRRPAAVTGVPEPAATAAARRRRPAAVAEPPEPDAAPAIRRRRPAVVTGLPEPAAAPAARRRHPAAVAGLPESAAAPAARRRRPAAVAGLPEPAAAPAARRRHRAAVAGLHEPAAAPAARRRRLVVVTDGPSVPLANPVVRTGPPAPSTPPAPRRGRPAARRGCPAPRRDRPATRNRLPEPAAVLAARRRLPARAGSPGLVVIPAVPE